MEFETIRYELVDDGTIARVILNRPGQRNAQNKRMTYELNDAFTTAALDDGVKVIVLSAEGPHFSAGHDTRSGGWEQYDHANLFPFSPTLPGSEGRMNQEQEVYFRMCRRWHDLPKPTIAQVHGKAISGGLMLAWVCDIIVASEDAEFIDVTAAPPFMVQGVEWFSHPFELGHRKAKEMLYTGDAVTAKEAHSLGMVNHVVPRDELDKFTLTLARKISRRSSFGHQLAKLAVNQALDAQGFWTSQQSSFNLQHLGHSHQRLMALQKEFAALQEEIDALNGEVGEDAQ